MKKIAFLVPLLGFLLSTPLVRAAEFLPSNPSGQVNVSASDHHKNLYTAGGTVAINGATDGDLTVAGGTLVLSGPVAGSLLAAGGNITLTGQVQGTARIAGGSLNINAPVGGDLVIGGGTVDISDAATVGGDLVVGGGTVTVNSAITGNVYAGAGTLTFGPKASVNGVVYYRGSNAATVDPAAHVPDIRFTKVENRHNFKTTLASIWTFSFLIQLLGLWLVCFLVLRFKRSALAPISEQLERSFWSSFGIGLLGGIAVPIAIIVLCVTLVGLYAGMLVLVSFVLLLMITTIPSAVFTGQKILDLISQRKEEYPAWLLGLIAALVWQLLKLIPIVGWAVMFVLFVAGFGAMLRTLKAKVWHS